MDIHLHVHFPDLANITSLLGLASVGKPGTIGGLPPAQAAVSAEDKAPAKAAKGKAAAAPAVDKEQAEIDGATNAGCIVMIKRVAAMDGKNPDGTDKTTGLKKATDIITSFGGCKVSELPKEKWAPFIADCQKALLPAEAAAVEPTALFG